MKTKNKKNYIVVIPARYDSTRLPGKVLMNADKTDTMLDYSIAQLKKCQYVDKIIIATSILERDDMKYLVHEFLNQ